MGSLKVRASLVWSRGCLVPSACCHGACVLRSLVKTQGDAQVQGAFNIESVISRGWKGGRRLVGGTGRSAGFGQAFMMRISSAP
jgi:hypothetical protein